MKRLIGLMVLTMIIVEMATGCKSNEVIAYEKETFVLGTFVNVKIYSTEKVDNDVFEDIFERLQQIENEMTINKDIDNDVRLVNQMAGVEAVPVAADTLSVIEKGLYYSGLTEGKFDITVGALVKLWDIGFEAAHVPEEKAVREALNTVGYEKVVIEDDSVYLEEKRMQIDLGGIAKGYAADEVVRILKEEGYTSAIVNIGGNIYGHGGKEGGNSFKVGIRDPFGSQNDYMGIASIKDQTVVSSGIYEKNFEEDGVFFHHIFNTETGYPVDNDLMSVSIICGESIVGDALSTGVFAMGTEEGLAFIEGMDEVEAVFITKDKKVYVSTGLEGNFELSGDGFEKVN